MRERRTGASRALLRAGLGVLVAGGLVACGSTPVPHAKVAESRAAMRAAEEVGATEVPRAELHLRLAKDQYNKAAQQIKKGDNEEAALTLERARWDAEVALALAQAAQEQARANQALAEIQTLSQENVR